MSHLHLRSQLPLVASLRGNSSAHKTLTFLPEESPALLHVSPEYEALTPPTLLPQVWLSTSLQEEKKMQLQLIEQFWRRVLDNPESIDRDTPGTLLPAGAQLLPVALLGRFWNHGGVTVASDPQQLETTLMVTLFSDSRLHGDSSHQNVIHLPGTSLC